MRHKEGSHTLKLAPNREGVGVEIERMQLPAHRHRHRQAEDQWPHPRDEVEGRHREAPCPASPACLNDTGRGHGVVSDFKMHSRRSHRRESGGGSPAGVRAGGCRGAALGSASTKATQFSAACHSVVASDRRTLMEEKPGMLTPFCSSVCCGAIRWGGGGQRRRGIGVETDNFGGAFKKSFQQEAHKKKSFL